MKKGADAKKSKLQAAIQKQKLGPGVSTDMWSHDTAKRCSYLKSNLKYAVSWALKQSECTAQSLVILHYRPTSQICFPATFISLSILVSGSLLNMPTQSNQYNLLLQH